MFQPDHRDSRPIYEQITDRFRQQIRTGVLQSGDKIPSVRELAASLSINPNTIQRSYRELEAEGWIISIPGKGSFVCKKEHNEINIPHLLEIFDQTARQLMDGGITAGELISRLNQFGGDENA